MSRILTLIVARQEQQPHLADRFRREASASLVVPAKAELGDIFEALEWRRLRLRQDQQLVEWSAGSERA
ncbi:hypothetical protein CHU93_00600 [Sandarakinorhabdus cyanobacteriorum]|uniref:Uncharacterized protein n=1 Tax=Sandarakinorhabdus cyanobacteriorum TaxID=1981098 RepID=A0A255Z8S3_9SPHN|nr:hypothetical protein CHU93_00600 [Sandarakinorhabdus cyanobacteriorum]